MDRLKGKVALITGANSGLGRSAALLFAREGAKVVLDARRREESEVVLKEIRNAGGDAIFVKTDVSRAEDCENVVAQTVKTFGKLDVAFNNAGVFSFGKTVAELSEQEWNRVMSINLTGVFLSMKYEIPEMLKAGGGSIVNMSSIGGLVGTSMGLSAYHAAKHGVLGLTKAAALEFAPKKIRVNAVCPALIPTSMSDEWFSNSGVKDALQAAHPIQRFGTPEEVAEATLFLASDASPFITGIALPVDGAFTAQ